MAAAKITSKGQITIPVRIRAALGISPGDRIEFVELERGRVVMIPATRSIKELDGMFSGRRSKPLTIDEMNAAIAEAAAESR